MLSVLLNNTGQLYSTLGDFTRALDDLGRAQALMREAGDLNGQFATASNIGTIYSTLGEYQRALDELRAALALARCMGDKSYESTALNNLGSLYNFLGKIDESIASHTEALAIARELQARGAQASALTNLASREAARDESQMALDQYAECCRSTDLEDVRAGRRGDDRERFRPHRGPVHVIEADHDLRRRPD